MNLDCQAPKYAMKTITLEIDERAYPSLIEFLGRLPAEHYRMLEDEAPLSDIERQEIERIRTRLRDGDDREFDDWVDVRQTL